MEKHRALIQVTEDLSKKEEPPPFFTLCEEIPETQPTWAGFRGIKMIIKTFERKTILIVLVSFHFCYLTPRC
jgi:hypothetical protein